MSGRLTGTSAVVTGASRGIGLAIARALVTHGARVVLMARTEAHLREQARALGPLAIPVRCDVSDERSVDDGIAGITQAFGDTPDVLVNNAGLFTLATVDQVDPAAFRTALETNLVAPSRFIRAFLPAMRARRRGHIVTVGSIADRAVFPENASYAASKHGARALHEVLRLETRGSGVRATLVSPGPVDTPLWDPIDPDRREGLTPRRAMLRPEAVAEAIIYVVSQPAAVNVDELRLSHS